MPLKSADVQARLRAKFGTKGTRSAGGVRRRAPRRDSRESSGSGGAIDSKTSATLKKLRLNAIPQIEEVNMFRNDNTVVQFKKPTVEAALESNTYVVNGKSETKKIEELLPGILSHMGKDSLGALKNLADSFSKKSGEFDDPGDLNFEEIADSDNKEAEMPDHVTQERLTEIWGELTANQRAGALILLDCEQGTLFDRWPVAGEKDAEKKAMLDLAYQRNQEYPGGLKEYRTRAIKLLIDSQKGINPLEGFVPSVPIGERLEFDSPEFHEFEKSGIEELSKCGIILLAGGLGERLGYSGIKPALPCDISSGMSFMEWYIRFLLSWQQRAREASDDDSIRLPLAIMVSGDTEEKTRQLLAENNNFGLEESQITWMRQNLMMTFTNSQGDFAMNDENLTLIGKPGGHGAIHYMMHSTGTAKKWLDQGVKWAICLQDTNGMAPRSLPASLGVSVKHNLVMNSVTVPRLPGEAIGAIAQLSNKETGESLTINVEYNQLGPLLDATGVDEKGSDGLSIFPGNCNTLIFDMKCYVETLEATGGVVPEFVNPKYTDDTKTSFKSPTRMESMMQDFPRGLSAENRSRVGLTQLPVWYAMNPVKNNLKDALVKYEKIGSAMSGSSGEAAMYYAHRRILGGGSDNIQVGESKDKRVYRSIPVDYGARVVIYPSFGGTVSEIRSKLNGSIQISEESTLILNGSNLQIDGLQLDGALVINGDGSSSIKVENLKVENDGWAFDEIDEEKEEAEEEIFRIRGYVLSKKGQRIIEFADGIDHTVTE